ncbi:unannotated protein [freshwater metagenome]|uniref:Unannotated protein n=1 Tax=freshwater metagenome TaxID=449393 RepID=A0A6J7VER9_9ZZZZ
MTFCVAISFVAIEFATNAARTADETVAVAASAFLFVSARLVTVADRRTASGATLTLPSADIVM